MSDRKLRQFLTGERGSPLGGTGVEGQVGFPPFASLKLFRRSGESSRAAELDRVIEGLDRSDRAARWFAEDSLQPGQWVHFEARLTHRVLDGSDFPATVFFLAAEPTGPAGAGVRMLLHGSVEHLIGAPPLDLDVTFAGESSGSGMGYHRPDNEWTRFDVRSVLEVLARVSGRSIPGVEPILHPALFDRHVLNIVRRMREATSPRTAAWMAGYARVTAVVEAPESPTRLHRFQDPGGAPRLLVATPLYVEHVSPPTTTG